MVQEGHTDLGIVDARSVRRIIQRDAERPRDIAPTNQSVSHEHARGERDALGQRAAHGELFLLGIAQDLRGFARIGVVELCLLEDVFVVRVDVDLAKGHGEWQGRIA